MTDINTRALDRELNRGAAELLILSLLDARPRQGYELSKLIHTRSGGQITFHIDSLYPLLYRLEERGWIKGAWVEKPDERRRRSAARQRSRAARLSAAGGVEGARAAGIIPRKSDREDSPVGAPVRARLSPAAPPSRFYKVTPKGRLLLAQQHKTWAAFVDAVQHVTGDEHA